MTYSADIKHEEALREVNYRIRVYKRLVSEGKMGAEVAARRVEIMQEIVADYEALASKERLL